MKNPRPPLLQRNAAGKTPVSLTAKALCRPFPSPGDKF